MFAPIEKCYSEFRDPKERMQCINKGLHDQCPAEFAQYAECRKDKEGRYAVNHCKDEMAECLECVRYIG